MNVELTDGVRCGRAIDLTDTPLDAETVVRAVRSEVHSPVIECARPGTLHEYVGCITPETSLRTRTALAVAARSRGLSAPQDSELAAVRERLSTHQPTTDNPRDARERLAELSGQLDRHRERVARLQGEVRALREMGATTNRASRALEDAIRELSEIETQHAAARQELEQTRARQRRIRDKLDERLALEDRAANLAREARNHLVSELEPEFETAVTAVPGAIGEGFDADAVSTALALGRVGDCDAPIVLGVDRFDSVQAATEWLRAPVIRVSYE